MVRNRMVWCGMVWYDTISYSKVWNSIVWYSNCGMVYDMAQWECKQKLMINVRFELGSCAATKIIQSFHPRLQLRRN